MRFNGYLGNSPLHYHITVNPGIHFEISMVIIDTVPRWSGSLR
ncbi:hypothetical protein D3OALGA1CA_4939 [Olavius algarvensis associated proteobacterium Delta 3]|nr:hypothetical protein D3OALGA1CA_4939 [Olavius algarvensis associated proteobacterium Delta 3]